MNWWARDQEVKTYRQILDDLDVKLCEDLASCRLRWANPGLATESLHQRGFVDTVNILHWYGADREIRVRSLFHLIRLRLDATREYRNDPYWLRLYRSSVAAGVMLETKFHRQPKVEWTAALRQRSWRLAHKQASGQYLGLAYREFLAYRDWVTNGLKTLPPKKRKYLRRPVTPAEVDTWRSLRDNGVPYVDISRKYKRSTKVIWSHIRDNVQ